MKKEILKTLTVALVAHVCLSSVACQKSASAQLGDAFHAVPPVAGEPDKQGQPEENVDFAKWESFVGNYRLVEFQGQPVSSRYTEIEARTSYYWDDQAKKNVESVLFPLFYSVSENMDASYNFGVLKDKGTHSIVKAKHPQTGKDIETLSFKFNGPITMQGQAIQMDLDLLVLADGESLFVTYTLTVKNHVQTTTRNFKLMKSN